jgi:hypothetical protein
VKQKIQAKQRAKSFQPTKGKKLSSQKALIDLAPLTKIPFFVFDPYFPGKFCTLVPNCQKNADFNYFF